ncbi:hypothetical protein pEaSNUABM37_00118 [Erwinia phage pEa_SNUABM_37]|nr:hypothetical protein pEaSNUABM37_00118 [Erwinia phage pEa_SNUABM_37]QXO10588.1 hypothetical protein pEaSNUABM48_00118 [Erwinia phage pEa_SNUABM_48]
MLEMLMRDAVAKTDDLFLIDWREGPGTKTTEVVSKTVFNVGGTGVITNDATLGNCFRGNAGGGMYQSGTIYNLINFSLTNWELSIDVIPAAVNNGGIVMSRAFNGSGTGGWYFGFQPSTQGKIEFYWVGSNGVWNALKTANALTVDQLTTLRLKRTGTTLELYFNDQLQSNATNVTFNNSNVVLAIGSFTDTFSSRAFNGKIGKIRFFVPKT